MFKRNCLLIFATAVVLAGCKKADDYPLEPSIEFKSLTSQKDIGGYDVNITMVVSFTDGDGDIGLLSSEIDNPPYVDEYRFDVHMHYFYRNASGAWIRDTTYDDDGYINVILTPEGNKKGIRGDISKGLDDSLPPGQTGLGIRYEVYFYDRALHKSNVITTPELVITNH